MGTLGTYLYHVASAKNEVGRKTAADLLDGIQDEMWTSRGLQTGLEEFSHAPTKLGGIPPKIIKYDAGGFPEHVFGEERRAKFSALTNARTPIKQKNKEDHIGSLGTYVHLVPKYKQLEGPEKASRLLEGLPDEIWKRIGVPPPDLKKLSDGLAISCSQSARNDMVVM